MSDGEDFELDSDESFGFTENENDAAWMTLHVVIQVAILIAAHVHKSALFVLFALVSQVRCCRSPADVQYIHLISWPPYLKSAKSFDG
jgi:hypothetical protein